MMPRRDGGPGLYRSGDIGVSAEWRDLTLDWTPVLTSTGVSMYAYLRDLYDQQQALFPFLNPIGPLKQKIQQIHGRETDWALRGPEYLLAAVGLVHVECGYGPSPDPDHPQRTRVAYYSIGRLTQPALDWPMLEHVLDALIIALDPPATHEQDTYKKAAAALQSLKQAGFLQACPPDRLFNEYGAWPQLLPILVEDERWDQLFTALHGAAAARRYREQARAWAASAERTLERLRDQNTALRELVQAAQRQGFSGRGSCGVAGSDPQTRALKPMPATPRATEAPRFAAQAAVAGESPVSRQAPQIHPPASATPAGASRAYALKPTRGSSEKESLDANQLTLRSRSREDEEQRQHSATTTEEVLVGMLSQRTANRIRTVRNPSTLNDDNISSVTSHLRDEELVSRRLDGRFWTEVNVILYGERQRYPHTAGEKKLAERKFYHQNIVTGVVLAALRTVAPIYHPQTFAEAVQLELFQHCVQQALALLPTRLQPNGDGRSWPEFLQAYRTVGLMQGARDVNAADYGMLASLYDQHAAACWEVLSRVSHAAQPVALTPAYLKRAIANNARANTAAARRRLPPTAQEPHTETIGDTTDMMGVTDPRVALLRGEGIDPRILTDAMSLPYIQAWVAEADARRASIKSRVGWLIWALESGCMPEDHPRLPKLSRGEGRKDVGIAELSGSIGRITSPIQLEDRAACELRSTWEGVLAELRQQVAPAEFATWLQETQLELVDRHAHTVVISTSNIFAREQLEQTYIGRIEGVLARHFHMPMHVQVVIAAPC